MINWFEFHPASKRTGPIHAEIRAVFRNTATYLIVTLPEGPDKTLALRKLQDAMMSANACVANSQSVDEDASPVNRNSVEG